MTIKQQANIVQSIIDLINAQYTLDGANFAYRIYQNGDALRHYDKENNRRWEAYNKLLRSIGIEDAENFYKRDCNGNLY